MRWIFFVYAKSTSEVKRDYISLANFKSSEVQKGLNFKALRLKKIVNVVLKSLGPHVLGYHMHICPHHLQTNTI